MNIYLECIFLENVIMDFVIIRETLDILRLRVNNKRIILASILSSLYVTIMLLFKILEMDFVISKLLLVLVIMYISIEEYYVKIYLKSILIFFMVSFINVGIYAGISNIFNIPVSSAVVRALVYIATYYLSKIIISRLWQMYKMELNKNELNYTVELNIGDKTYFYSGFLDTGNTVCCCGMPVIFAEVIDEKMLQGLEKNKSFNVKTVTLGNVCTKTAYILEDIKISNKKQTWFVNAGVVFEKRQFSKTNNYNMILNYILYTDSMGGIKI
ncbi:MAG: sigma-E processing peptidase SpoIIGA [Clostridia bacterium]|nr:sigma-E processing peptidase SpoIIGA [Clostridia bacterium]MBR6641372.1 sigma-E processing peptidase SpoIIGA [Clostridia bacterium]